VHAYGIVTFSNVVLTTETSLLNLLKETKNKIYVFCAMDGREVVLMRINDVAERVKLRRVKLRLV
jgi:hypothetical protein